MSKMFRPPAVLTLMASLFAGCASNPERVVKTPVLSPSVIVPATVHPQAAGGSIPKKPQEGKAAT